MCRTINSDGVILDCNRAYVKGLGYGTKNEIIGTSIFDSVDGLHKEQMMKSFELWRRTGKVHNFEVWLKRKDGSTFPALINATAIRDESGILIASNTVIIDSSDIYTTRKSLEGAVQQLFKREKELKEINEELKGVEKAKEQFISMISHELKTPLVPIKGYSDMLLRPSLLGELNDKQKKAMQTIARSCDKLETLVEDVLSVFKLDMEKMTYSKSDVEIEELVDRNISDLRSLLADKQIDVKSEIKTAGTVFCDPKRIDQVFSNLLKNSIDFVPLQGGKINVKAEKSNDSQVVFSVEDNGKGIPADKIDKLFQKFYQIDTSATRKHGGTGLGLAICKGIIEAHGGEIWVDKTYTCGASIKFVLPRDRSVASKGDNSS
jgi:PAS domain S-box-containing protein